MQQKLITTVSNIEKSKTVETEMLDFDYVCDCKDVGYAQKHPRRTTPEEKANYCPEAATERALRAVLPPSNLLRLKEWKTVHPIRCFKKHRHPLIDSCKPFDLLNHNAQSRYHPFEVPLPPSTQRCGDQKVKQAYRRLRLPVLGEINVDDV
jgi:hypothetical protein